MNIGVFDSGIGGEKIAILLRKEFTNDNIVAISDAKNLPYGNKTKEELLALVLPKLLELQKQCDVIVIACNTVTTLLITILRQRLYVPLVGFEPMIKPASKVTKSKIVAVCATPATLKSPRYNNLKKQYASGINIIEPDCSKWADLIERNAINTSHIDSTMRMVIEKGADVIVLGCTHYHWIEKEINTVTLGKAIILQPEQPVLRRITSLVNTIN